MSWHNGHHSHSKGCAFQSGRKEPQRERSTIRDRFRLLSSHQIENPLQQVGRRIARNGAFIRQKSHHHCCNSSKPCGDVTADIVQRPIVEKVALDIHSCELHSRINCGTNRPPQRIPHHIIKPLKELFRAMFIQVLSGDKNRDKKVRCVA